MALRRRRRPNCSLKLDPRLKNTEILEYMPQIFPSIRNLRKLAISSDTVIEASDAFG